MRTISTIRLMALDLDGTTLGTDLKISPRTRAAVMRARERGVRFVILTGRMYQSAAKYAGELELEGTPLVAYNGGLVCEYPSGKVLLHQPVPLDVCRRLAAFCETQGYHAQGYVNDRLYVPDLGPRTRQYQSTAQVEAHVVGPLSRWLTVPSTKMMVVDDPERIPRIEAELRALLGPEATVVRPMPAYLEIVHPEVSKGRALQALAEQYGVAREDTAAAGDAYNDVTMLAWAGVSFAMAHAPEAVKQAATYVTEAAPGDGVAEALERLGF